MEIQLQELIDKIKADGAEKADREAAQKIADANAEAERIVADAKAEAARITAAAKADNDRMVKSGEDAIRQAARNILIQFRESVTKELDAILRAEIDQNYSGKKLETLIPEVITAWAGNVDAEDISVLLNEKDLEAVEQNLLGALQKKLAGGVTLKADDSFDGGFRVAEKDGSAYYDFSAESVAEMFSVYLNPRTAALLKEATTL